jgi:hypothetical protein
MAIKSWLIEMGIVEYAIYPTGALDDNKIVPTGNCLELILFTPSSVIFRPVPIKILEFNPDKSLGVDPLPILEQQSPSLTLSHLDFIAKPQQVFIYIYIFSD